jgi:hypothetical protein
MMHDGPKRAHTHTHTHTHIATFPAAHGHASAQSSVHACTSASKDAHLDGAHVPEADRLLSLTQRLHLTYSSHLGPRPLHAHAREYVCHACVRMYACHACVCLCMPERLYKFPRRACYFYRSAYTSHATLALCVRTALSLGATTHPRYAPLSLLPARDQPLIGRLRRPRPRAVGAIHGGIPEAVITSSR